MKRFSAGEVAAALKGSLYGVSADTVLTGGVVTDSRDVSPGDIYVARRGEHVDGITFAPAAVEAGAALVIAEAVPAVDGEHLPTLHVTDATAALGQLASLNVSALRESGELTVIAITGSAGKTTAKDLISDLLLSVGETVWPPNSYNNEVGVPLTALQAGDTTRFRPRDGRAHDRQPRLPHLAHPPRHRRRAQCRQRPLRRVRLRGEHRTGEGRARRIAHQRRLGGAQRR